MVLERSDSKLISVSSAARRLGISRHRLLRAVRNGELTAIRPGIRTLYVTWPEVRRWLSTLSVGASEHPRDCDHVSRAKDASEVIQ